jgi:DNA-binding MarR family transcriptional regulator
LLDLIDRLARLARTGRQQSDVVPAQREALSYLARANRFSRTPSALAIYLGVTKGTVSQTVIALERRGYLTKTANPADARSVRLDLTGRGRDALFEVPVEPLARAMQSLPAARRTEIDSALVTLLSSMIAETGGRPFGLCKLCRHFEGDGRHPAGGPHRCRLLDEPLSIADSELICAEQQAA